MLWERDDRSVWPLEASAPGQNLGNVRKAGKLGKAFPSFTRSDFPKVGFQNTKSFGICSQGARYKFSQGRYAFSQGRVVVFENQISTLSMLLRVYQASFTPDADSVTFVGALPCSQNSPTNLPNLATVSTKVSQGRAKYSQGQKASQCTDFHLGNPKVSHHRRWEFRRCGDTSRNSSRRCREKRVA